MENSIVAILYLGHVRYKCTVHKFHKYIECGSPNSPADLVKALFYFHQSNIPHTLFFSLLIKIRVVALRILWFPHAKDPRQGLRRSHSNGGCRTAAQTPVRFPDAVTPRQQAAPPSAPICSTVDANFLAMVPVAKIPHFISVPPSLSL